MKHAITGPHGRIFRVLDESNDHTLPITNAQAALVESKADPHGYWIIDGTFTPGTEVQAARKAAREAERVAAMTPEQRTSHETYQAAAAVFESLDLGKQALWEPVRVRVAEFITKGDFASAQQTIATVPPLYPGIEDDRALFLALLQS